MELTILTTSDIHGYLYPTNYINDTEEVDVGLFKIATVFKEELQTAKGPVLLIENGDFIQGSPMSQYVKEKLNTPEILLSALNELNYDLGILGNHEFNYGTQYLKKAIKAAKHPILSANILKEDGDYFADAPVKIIEKGHLKIGVLGLTTQYIPNWEHPSHIQGLSFSSAVEVASEWVPKLREQVDVVVVAYHGGFEADLVTGEATETDTGENEGSRLLKEVSGIDVLITGHQHREIATTIESVPVVQPGLHGEKIGKIVLTLNENNEIVDRKAELLSVESVPADKNLMEKYSSLQNSVNKWLDEGIGYTKGNMKIEDADKVRLREHPYIEFVNRVQLFYSEADISCTALFSNDGPGYGEEITIRDVILNYPYPNTLAVIKITGKELKEALEQSANYFILDDNQEITINPTFKDPKPKHYNYDMYEGIDYIIDVSKPFGERITKLEFKGQPVQPQDEFELVTNQYRAVGGGNFKMFEGKEFVREIDQSMNDLITKFIQEEGVIPSDINHNFKVIH